MGSPTFAEVVLVTMVTFTFLSLLPTTSGTEQKVTFYENSDCSGKTMAYTSSANGLKNSWVGRDAKSFKILGIWSFTLTSTVNQTYLGTGKPTESSACLTKGAMVATPNTFVFTAIEMIGLSDMTSTDSYVRISDRNDLTGNSFSFTPGKGYDYDSGKLITISPPMLVKSWALFGSRSWITYAKANDSSVSNCLRKTHGVDGFTVNRQASFVVQALRPAKANECGQS